MAAFLAVLPLVSRLAPVVSHLDAYDSPLEDCGKFGYPACSVINVTTGYTIHSCMSDESNGTTIGAVPERQEGTSEILYVCKSCGRPFEPACECTNEVNGMPNPCTSNTSAWCLFGPQYIASERHHTGFNYCIHNETDTEAEELCGLEGNEACLDIDEGVYSCLSPNPEGAEIEAVQDSVGTTAPYMCRRSQDSSSSPDDDEEPELFPPEEEESDPEAAQKRTARRLALLNNKRAKRLAKRKVAPTRK
jgi:hypothetical protein